MATQIFIEPELENLDQADNAAEWFELCSQLGLNAQLSLADMSEEKKAPPYMFIDPKTERIIRTLCPSRTKYQDFNSSTIPLDVLQELQKCEQNKWYEKIEIYSDDKSPDPFVVGFFKLDKYRLGKHLIARWGAELVPFEILEAKAIARIKDAAFERLSKTKAEIEFAIGNIDLFCRSLLGGQSAPSVKLSVPALEGWVSSDELPF